MKIFHAVSVAVFTLLVGCDAGNGVGLDQNGEPTDRLDNIPLADNLRSIQTNIFTPSCATSGCHSGVAPPEGLLLTEGNSFNNLVSIPSEEAPSFQRVNINDADNSYLIQKLEGTASAGLQMPRNQPPLSIEKIQAIKDWINNGALGPTLTSIQANIFTPICVECHAGSSPPAGLNLENGNTFSNITNVKRLFGDEILVTSGQPDNSFLIDKHENNNLGASRGDPMPLGSPSLNQAVIDVIRTWIEDGANNN